MSIVCAASLSALATQPAMAESVAVDGNSVYILDNSIAGSQIVVRNLINGALNSCLADAGFNLLGLSADTTATEIVIRNNIAVITTFNSTTLVTDAQFVNVASCAAPIIPVGECFTTLDNGLLTIPCVQYNGEIFTAILEQRGGSMNWELKSSPILNDTFAGH